MSLNIIVATGNNGQIGLNNNLPWYLKDDLKNFKKITDGSTILMGRKTFESIGRPLPNRKNIILTKNKTFAPEGCIIANSLKMALELSKNDRDVFICGGKKLYKEAMDTLNINKIYITLVDYNGEADTFFPKIDFSRWKITMLEEHKKDNDNQFDYEFLELERK